MHRFRGMQEHRRRPRAAQRRHDLARDVAALADAGDHHLPGMRQDQLHRANQFAVQPGGGAADGFRLNFHGGARGGEPIVLRARNSWEASIIA